MAQEQGQWDIIWFCTFCQQSALNYDTQTFFSNAIKTLIFISSITQKSGYAASSKLNEINSASFMFTLSASN